VVSGDSDETTCAGASVASEGVGMSGLLFGAATTGSGDAALGEMVGVSTGGLMGVSTGGLMGVSTRGLAGLIGVATGRF